MKKKMIAGLLALTIVAGSTGNALGAVNIYHYLQIFVPQLHKPVVPEINVGGNGDNTTEDNESGDNIISNTKASQILSLVNKERQAKGLSNLKADSKLNRVAQIKAEDMAKKGYFSHTSPTYGSPFDMLKYFGVSYKTAGENIAKGQKTAQSAMNGWMNSQGHRANILNSKYTKLGVGYATDSRGNTYWVQMFVG